MFDYVSAYVCITAIQHILWPQQTGPQDTRFGESYPSVETQSVYSVAPVDWASLLFNLGLRIISSKFSTVREKQLRNQQKFMRIKLYVKQNISGGTRFFFFRIVQK